MKSKEPQCPARDFRLTVWNRRQIAPVVKRRSDCDPWRTVIEANVALGLSAKRIHQDLVSEQHATVGYDSVRRFIERLGASRPLPMRRLECAAGGALLERRPLRSGIGPRLNPSGESRLERAEAMAGVDLDEELAGLPEQTMNLDEAFDGQTSTASLDPIQSADLLDRELQRKTTARPVAARPVSLAERLVGKWQAVEGKKKGIVEFTKGGTALVSWNDPFPNALGNSGRRATLKYNVAGNTLKLEEPGDNEYRQKQEMQIEVISEDEIIFVVQKRAMSYDWLDGRVQRLD